jgi:cell division septum initiation protein DivIVA
MQHNEVDRVKAQVWELERRVREATASEAAARRECQRLIDSGPGSQSEFNSLARAHDAEVARRKKADAEIDRLMQSLRLNSGAFSDTTGARSPITFDTSEAEMMQTELLMKEIEKV